MKSLTFKVFLMLLLLFCGAKLRAQTFSLSWFKVAGGGGTSTNGIYTLSDTFGQPDAGVPMQGGGFSVQGGFWSTLSQQYFDTNGMAPTITTQPQNMSVSNGVSGLLSVGVSGTPPFFYQWQINGTNVVDGGNLSGSTTAALTVSTGSITNLGQNYSFAVVVANAYGTVTSSVATVQVAPFFITTQPVNQATRGISNVIFSVSVSGIGPFSYQWQHNGTNLPGNIITTVAGNGTLGYSGDGGAATNAEVNLPYGVATDPFGNSFIADTYNSRIRKVNANGIITTVTGDGTFGFSGDGGTATNAQLYYPSGMAMDSFANLFIADLENSRIRKMDANGIITTVAGDGMFGYSGDGGPATNAQLSYCGGVAVDSFGSIFIADIENSRIRKVDTNGVIITVAGNGYYVYSGDGGPATNAGVYYPFGVAMDFLGNLFIADNGNNRIRKVDKNGIIITMAGNGNYGYSGDGGNAANAELNGPTGVAVDCFGNLFIADAGNNRIRKVDTNGIITTVAGDGTFGYSGDNGAAISAELTDPIGVAVDSFGNLLIADTDNERIRKVVFQGPELVLTNLSPGSAGNYDVVVTGDFGSVTSSVVSLSLLPPVITAQPVSQTTVQGATAQFNVSAVGRPPLIYQWQKNGINLTSGGDIAGATSNILTVSSVSAADEAVYSVMMSDVFGTANSVGAVLTVNTVSLTPAFAVLNNTNQAQFTSLTPGADGNLYGTMQGGGMYDSGGIFVLTTNGVLSNLFSFNGTNGSGPAGAMIQTANGIFYGTTEGGGTNGGYGTIYQITTGGAFASLYSFNFSNGSRPMAAMTQGGDGNFYGTTFSGGTNFNQNEQDGTVFQATTNGTITTLEYFTGTPGRPAGPVVQGLDGLFYGVAAGGDSAFYSVSTYGAFNTVASFPGLAAYNDPILCFRGPDGDFYGIAFGNSSLPAYGVVYSVATNGAFTTLAGFQNTNGAYPNSLISGRDGNLYGTTQQGGTQSSGTVFQLTTNGVLTTLVNFNGRNGYGPSALIQGLDGNLYGIAYQNSSNLVSTIFRVNLTPAVLHFPILTYSGNNFTASWQVASGQIYQAQYLTNLTSTNWVNLGAPVAAINGIATISDTVAAGSTQRFYRIVLVP